MKVRLERKLRKLTAAATVCCFIMQPLATFAAAADANADAGRRPDIRQEGNALVVDIAKPDANGLSHNIYSQFNVGPGGLILNNGVQSSNTVLAGLLAANGRLDGRMAAIILNEVSGSGMTHLNGLIEVAGGRSAVIIANPNGIAGNGFGFINTDRVSLVTGRPSFDANGNLSSFRVSGGQIAIAGEGLIPGRPAGKLDLLTRAAVINAQLWADQINVVTGSNDIDYQTLTATPVASAQPAPALALDVGALGGMYAGKILLVGTERGLGVAVRGEILASEQLLLQNDGKLVVHQTMVAGKPVNGALSAGSDLTIDVTEKLVNDGQLTAGGNIDIRAAHVASSGMILAGELLDDDDDGDDDAHDGGLDAGPITMSGPPADVAIQAGGAIDISGVVGATQAITLDGTRVTYRPDNLFAESVKIAESDPLAPPEPPASVEPDLPPLPERPGGQGGQGQTIETVISPGRPDLPALPAISPTPGPAVPVERESGLALTADRDAPGQYKPIIDRTESGIDLVQIAAPSAGGVSRNLYTDFNINPGGLILNNATRYAKTQLGGYIDYNTRLGGIAANVILNEVTSANPSYLNGFLEVAGNRASVVIANPNGMTVNGMGFINADNAVLSTGIVSTYGSGTVAFYPVAGGDIVIQGAGLNATAVQQLHIAAHSITNASSELWANRLVLSADGRLANSGLTVAHETLDLAAGRLHNIDGGAIVATGDLTMAVQGDIINQAAAVKSNGSIAVTGASLDNLVGGAIYSQNGLQLTVSGQIKNEAAAIQTGGNAVIAAASLDNSGNAAIYTDGDLDLTTSGAITNTAAAIYAAGRVDIEAAAFDNRANALMMSGHDLNIETSGGINNVQATIFSGGGAHLTGENVTNRDGAYLAGQAGLDIAADGSIVNQASAIASGGDITVGAQAVANEQGATLEADGRLTVAARASVDNQASALRAGQALAVTADAIVNHDGAWLTGSSVNLNAASAIVNERSAVSAQQDVAIAAAALVNRDRAVVTSGGNLSVDTSGDIANQAATIRSGGDMAISSNNVTNDNAYLAADGNLLIDAAGQIGNTNADITAGGSARLTGQSFDNTGNAAVFVDGDLALTAAQHIGNDDSVIAAGGRADLTAGSISNTNNAIVYSAGDLSLTAVGDILNQSSGMESQSSIAITAERLINEKAVFETDWDVDHQDITYGIDPVSGHYSASRKFAREIKTGAIRAETAAAQILAGQSITIDGAVINHYSTIAAGDLLAIRAPYVENYGYQGTAIITDQGTDTHNWKYKKHKRFHMGCRWVYGTTIIPYYNQDVEQRPSARLGVLSGATVDIQAGSIDNRTFDAGGNTIEFIAVPSGQPDVTDHLTGSVKGTDQIAPGIATDNSAVIIAGLAVNGKIFTVNTDPAAKYLVETDPRFANYQNFLSSDYLLERVKTDPDKVIKRLGDGYYEQKLVTDQITALTGRRFLNNYSSDLEQYKALMNSAAVFANEFNLTVGVALTAEQMAALTSDMVWLVEEVIDGQRVLVPQVYLASLHYGDLTSGGAVITGSDVTLIAGDDLSNIGTIRADNQLRIDAENITNKYGAIAGGQVDLTARDTLANQSGRISGTDVDIHAGNIINQTLTNTGEYGALKQTTLLDTAAITAQNNLTVTAEDNISNQGAVLSAGKELVLSAGGAIAIESVSQERHVAVVYDKSSAELHSIEHSGSLVSGGNVSIDAGNITVRGSAIAADGDLSLSAQENINILADKDLASADASVGRRGGYYFNREQTMDETVVGATMTAGGNIGLTSGQDINIQGSSVVSETGAIGMTAGENINITAESEHHERLQERHTEKTGMLSSTKTDIYDHQTLEAVQGSSLSGGSIDIKSGQDITLQGSALAADGNIAVTAGGDIHLQTADQTSEHQYDKTVTKSGMFGSGLGVTIGKQTTDTAINESTTQQMGSLIGSVDGNIEITAGGSIDSRGTTVVSGGDIAITGSDVTIENSTDLYDYQREQHFKQSGISVSLGGGVIDLGTSMIDNIERGSEAEDSRLQAIYDYKALQDANKLKDSLEQNKGDITAGLSVGVSVGSSKSDSQQTVHVESANTSHLSAGGDVTITATQGDINLKGVEVEGETIHLKAEHDINISAAQNNEQIDSQSKSSSWSVGVDLATGSISGSVSKGKTHEDGSSVTHEQSKLTGKDTVIIESGNDTNIIGGQVSGDRVIADIGGDLNLASVQDSDNYHLDSKGGGLGVGISSGSVGASASKGTADSDYVSVTDQTGIYAGEGGFDIQVGGNTDLKGAVISSEATPDKNKLSTDTLTYEDIENKAEYELSTSGVAANTGRDSEKKDAGVTPIFGGSSGDASSTTKSAISKGVIEIRSDEGKTDLSGLSRDPDTANNPLNPIFDKEKVLEQQEVAALLGEIGFKFIGDLAEKNHWTEAERIVAHGIIGGLMTEINGGKFGEGLTVAAINKLVVSELIKRQKELGLSDAEIQWISAGLGTAIADATGSNTNMGAGIASSGTKNNDVGHAGRDPVAIDPTEKAGNYYQSDGRFYQVDANGNPHEVSPEQAIGQRVWAVAGDGTAGWWTVGSDGNLNWAGATGERRYENGQVWQIGTDGKDYAVQVSIQEEKSLENKKILDENNDLLLLALAGRDIRLAGKMIGADGVQVTSKTLWKEKGSSARIDVENPNPGQRPGQIHYQDERGNKYLYDIEKGAFVDKSGNLAPKSVNDNLKNPDFIKKIKEGLEKYLGVK